MTNEEVIEYVKTLDWYKDIIKRYPKSILFLGGSRGRRNDNFVTERSDYDLILYTNETTEFQNEKVETGAHCIHCFIIPLHHLIDVLTGNPNFACSKWLVIGQIHNRLYTPIIYNGMEEFYKFLCNKNNELVAIGCYRYLDSLAVLFPSWVKKKENFMYIGVKTKNYILQCYEEIFNITLKKDFIIQLKSRQLSNEHLILLQEILDSLWNFYINFDWRQSQDILSELEVMIQCHQ